MPGTAKSELIRICEEMKWDDKEELGYDDMDRREDTMKTSNTRLMRVTETNTKLNLELIDPKMALSANLVTGHPAQSLPAAMQASGETFFLR